MKKSILFFVVVAIYLNGGLYAGPECGMETNDKLRSPSPIERIKATENQDSQAVTALKNENFLRGKWLWKNFLRTDLISKDKYDLICEFRKTADIEILQKTLDEILER